jgi:hypothetical protein
MLKEHKALSLLKGEKLCQFLMGSYGKYPRVKIDQNLNLEFLSSIIVRK